MAPIKLQLLGCVVALASISMIVAAQGDHSPPWQRGQPNSRYYNGYYDNGMNRRSAPSADYRQRREMEEMRRANEETRRMLLDEIERLRQQVNEELYYPYPYPYPDTYQNQSPNRRSRGRPRYSARASKPQDQLQKDQVKQDEQAKQVKQVNQVKQVKQANVECRRG